MNKMTTMILVFLLLILCQCHAVTSAQIISNYEFECEYPNKKYECPIRWDGDTVLVVYNLFNEMTISDEVTFAFRDNCVYLTIDGQEGLFFGSSELGSWNNKENEDERFTIMWDTIHCPIDGDLIFRFKFIPYYHEENPYTADDGCVVFHTYDDAVSYYWIPSAGVVAIEGDLLFVRRDRNPVKSCLKSIK